jgi:membrane-associated phospholipid phosphatase
VPDAVLDAGIEIIRWIAERRTPVLTAFLRAVTEVGSTIGYLVLLPLLWWGLSWKLAVRLFVALVLSVYVNAVLKDAVALPRPFQYAELANITTPDEYSFPSGHAQSAALFWTLFALHVKKRWFTVFAATAAFLVGFSRVYLGVHYPTDVAAGWIVGTLLALAFARWSLPAVRWAEGLGLGSQLALSIAAPAALTLLHGTSNTAMALGGLAGALGGLAYALSRDLYPEGGDSRGRRAWLVTGLAGLPLLYFGLRSLSPGEGSSFYHLYLFLRFAAIGLWVSFLVPGIVARFRGRGEGEIA